MKCFINTCNNDADYLIQSKAYFNHIVGKDNKRPICAKCVPFICWNFKLYTLDNHICKR